MGPPPESLIRAALTLASERSIRLYGPVMSTKVATAAVSGFDVVPLRAMPASGPSRSEWTWIETSVSTSTPVPTQTSSAGPGTFPVLQFVAVVQSGRLARPTQCTVQVTADPPPAVPAAGPDTARAEPPPATTSTAGTARPSAKRGQFAGPASLLIESPFSSRGGTRPRWLRRPSAAPQVRAAWPVLPIRLTAPSGLRTR